MRRSSVVNSRWFLAVLIFALLGGVAHAAEFGSGEHYHDGVACSFGLGSDDDHGLVRSAPATEVAVGLEETIPRPLRSIDARIDALLPPSTGPPKVR